MKDFTFKSFRKAVMIIESARDYKYSVNDLVKLVAMLRFSNGFKARCHESIRSDLIRDAYDVLEAIDLEDGEKLKRGLGDIILQVMYHCDIEDENKNFSFGDVVDSACKKLVSKYPYGFYKKNLENSAKEKCKVYNIAEHSAHLNNDGKIRNIYKSRSERIENVPKTLPALVRAYKIQQQAQRCGYGIFSVEDALNEAFERLHYLETLILDNRQEYCEKEIGNLMFSIAEVARLIDVDAESALYNSCEKYKNEILCKISLENKDKV